jgi:2C-methyl-D-erythritol 2,4-cyclodiphosphate synthase
MNRAVERAKDKYERGLIDKEQMLRSISQARSTAFGKIQKLSQQYPKLVSDSLLDYMTNEILNARDRLGDYNLRQSTEQPADASKVEGAPPTNRYPVKTPSQIAGMGSNIQSMGGGLSALKSAAGAADSVGDINSLIAATRAQFDTLNNEEARNFIGVLQKAKDKMQETQTEAKLIGQALSQSVARSADRAFQAIGDAFSSAIFGGGGGNSTAQSKLNLFNAKEQITSLRETLRKGNISYRKFAIRMKVQQNKVQKRQEQLNNAMQSGFAKAAESMLSAFKQVAKQLIAEITAVMAKMAVLKAITAAFEIGSGGFLGSVISNLGGGAFLDSGASGGMVKQSGLAVIHEDEQIMNAETVSMLDNLLQPSTPNAQPAMTGGANMNITVNVTGKTTTDGRDL